MIYVTLTDDPNLFKKSKIKYEVFIHTHIRHTEYYIYIHTPIHIHTYTPHTHIHTHGGIISQNRLHTRNKLSYNNYVSPQYRDDIKVFTVHKDTEIPYLLRLLFSVKQSGLGLFLFIQYCDTSRCLC